mmetsp:Transcript_29315/g.68653  ORF Transcript_29315/g.68653 Transcript_29315/m.68653 type:complete len:84 (+) Transcript_29315:201-452(+)
MSAYIHKKTARLRQRESKASQQQQNGNRGEPDRSGIVRSWHRCSGVRRTDSSSNSTLVPVCLGIGAFTAQDTHLTPAVGLPFH